MQKPIALDSERLWIDAANVVAVLPISEEKRAAQGWDGRFKAQVVAVGSEGKLHDKEEVMESAHVGELKDYYAYNLRVVPVTEEAAIVTHDCVIHMPEGDAPGMAPRYQHISDLWVKQNDQWRLKFQQAMAARPVD